MIPRYSNWLCIYDPFWAVLRVPWSFDHIQCAILECWMLKSKKRRIYLAQLWYDLPPSLVRPPVTNPLTFWIKGRALDQSNQMLDTHCCSGRVMYVWMDMQIAVKKELLFVFAVKPWASKAQDPEGFPFLLLQRLRRIIWCLNISKTDGIILLSF